METWVTEIIREYGYIGVFLTMVLENVFPPIPSEIVLPFSGFMTTKTNLSPILMIIVASLGSITGAVILYWIGSKLNVERLEGIVERWGHILRLKKEDVRKADAWFDRYGIWTVLFCRIVPLIRSLISIPAGMSGMPFSLFLLFTTIGTLVWNTILILIGVNLGSAWPTIVGYMDLYSNFIYVLLVLLAILALFWYLKLVKKRKNS
ncbi:DedA family protein [Radiobacillus kanasensis]|uniref:DedA family protein n=1 Tax=Radiobacillus kanasensis TaxID=2844358 RepID=UPI001E36A512|nr:DedA family protein [Radiobacillus kanasensis]UFU00328.1 DedA family protein [Radiobacillus kanasensis]